MVRAAPQWSDRELFFSALSLVYQAPVFKFNITAVFCWETCGGPKAANVPPPHGWGRAGWWLERAVASTDVQGLILWCINCRLPHVQLIKGKHSKGQKEKCSDEATFTSNALVEQKRPESLNRAVSLKGDLEQKDEKRIHRNQSSLIWWSPEWCFFG